LFIIAGSCHFSRNALAEEENEDELSLDQVLALVLQNNRNLKNADLEVDKSGKVNSIIQYLRYPEINVNFLYSLTLISPNLTFKAGQLGSLPDGTLLPTTDVTIADSFSDSYFAADLTQPLSQQYRIGLQAKVGRKDEEISKERLREERHNAVNEATQVYYSILETKSAIRSGEAKLQASVENQRVAGNLLAERQILASQQLDAKAHQEEAQFKLLSLKDQLNSKKEKLNEMMGRDISTPLDIVESTQLKMPELNSEELLQKAMAQRPELKESRAYVIKTKEEIKAKQAERIPDVGLKVSYFKQLNNIEVLPEQGAFVGVVMNWKPMDLLRIGKEVAIKDRAWKQAVNKSEELETDVKRELNDVLRRMEKTKVLLQSAETYRKSAQENFRVMKNKYNERAILLKDFNESKAMLEEADYQYEQVRLRYLATQAELKKIIGEDCQGEYCNN